MTRKSIACIAAAVAAIPTLVAPIGAQAHDWRRDYYQDRCTDRIHDNGVAGLLLGGAAGAAIGSNLARHGGRTGGALLGAAAGAAIGSNIARSTTKDRCRGPREVGYYYAPPPPPPPVYVAPEPVYMAPPPPPPPYGYVIYDERPHDHGWHRGWREHRHHDEDDED